MGQSPSNLLTSLPTSTPTSTSTAADDDKRLEADDALTSMALLADLKTTAFFGDVHYESSIEGDVLLPLDKVVLKGSRTWCNVSAAREAVGREMEGLLGGLLRADVVDAVGTTISQVLANAIAETTDPAQKNYSEKRGFSIVVGHLGGIYRLNHLLFTYTYRSAFRHTCANYLVAAWALSSVRLDWLALNAVNIAIEQSFLHAEGESHEDFRKRVDGIKALALRDWDDDQVREAMLERRKKKAGREGNEGAVGV